MITILLGAPGAGKGTQAVVLEERLALPHVASGDLFRENVKAGTELGRQARVYMDRGELVPDSVTIAMVMERLAKDDCRRGVILDGFPRTVEQARALEAALAKQGKIVDGVLYFQVASETLLARLSGRWICRQCQANYHTVFNPPKEPGKCDACGGELYQRPDDKRETAEHRLEVYFAQTIPLIEYYRSKGLLIEINGEQGIEQVTGDLLAAIEKLR
jgi:adenylate kinase